MLLVADELLTLPEPPEDTQVFGGMCVAQTSVVYVLCSVLWFIVYLFLLFSFNHRSVANHWQTLWHNVVSSTSRLSGIQTHNDNSLETCRSCKSLVFSVVFSWPLFVSELFFCSLLYCVSFIKLRVLITVFIFALFIYFFYFGGVWF